MNTRGPGRRADGSMLLYTDDLAQVHVGDEVRYVQYDWRTKGRYYYRAGIVTGLGHGGSDAIHVRFAHYRREADLSTVADHLRLVRCIHQNEGNTNERTEAGHRPGRAG